MNYKLTKEEQAEVEAARNRLRAEFKRGFMQFKLEEGIICPAPTSEMEEAYHKGEVAAEKVVTRAREVATHDFYNGISPYNERCRPSELTLYTHEQFVYWRITYGLDYNLHFEMYCTRYDEAYYNKLREMAGLSVPESKK